MSFGLSFQMMTSCSEVTRGFISQIAVFENQRRRFSLNVLYNPFRDVTPSW
jgi:hypothetical protein